MTSRKALLLPLLVLLAGCSSNPLPPAATSDKAAAGLKAGLEAWQKGDKPETLQNGTPPIYFTDLSWRAGHRLLAYQLSNEEPERFGQSLRWSVTLELEDSTGGKKQKKTVYNIDTDPAIVIVPADM